jgi:hypothetical protein
MNMRNVRVPHQDLKNKKDAASSLEHVIYIIIKRDHGDLGNSLPSVSPQQAAIGVDLQKL